MLGALKNGEVRFLRKADATLTDDQGFPSSGYVPRTTEFFPCVWTAKAIDEKEVAGQTRALAGYEIQVSGSAEVHPSDRVELRFKLGSSETETLEIAARVNESNVTWRIVAVDIEE